MKKSTFTHSIFISISSYRAEHQLKHTNGFHFKSLPGRGRLSWLQTFIMSFDIKSSSVDNDFFRLVYLYLQQVDALEKDFFLGVLSCVVYQWFV